jgi:hypothetical protein
MSGLSRAAASVIQLQILIASHADKWLLGILESSCVMLEDLIVDVFTKMILSTAEMALLMRSGSDACPATDHTVNANREGPPRD